MGFPIRCLRTLTHVKRLRKSPLLLSAALTHLEATWAPAIGYLKGNNVTC